jgi:hypothetical protein
MITYDDWKTTDTSDRACSVEPGEMTEDEQIEQVLAGKFFCLECGDPGPHDDNGAMRSHRSFCCAACGTHQDADQVLEALGVAS